MSTTVAGHAFAPAHQRPSLFVRAWAAVRSGWIWLWSGWRMALAATEAEAEPEAYESGAGFPEAAPTQALPRVEVPAVERPAPGHPLFPEGQTIHPPFAPRPAEHVHVAIRMQRVLVEASWDPNLTPTKLAAALGPLNAELSELVLAEQKRALRMARNQAAATAQRVLLDDALHGADPEAIVAQAASAMVARAAHVGSVQDTGIGVIPRITEEMPDPRAAAEPVPVEAAPEPAVPVEPDHAWTSEELSELGDVADDAQAEAGQVVAS